MRHLDAYNKALRKSQKRLTLRECPECLCVGQYGVCHCDRDIYGTNCYKRGRHERI